MAADLCGLPLEVLTAVCEQLDLLALVHVALTCKRFRHGDGGLETVQLPTKSPVVTALLEHAFPGGRMIPGTRPIGCFESWVTYLARCVRQRRCREASPLAAGGHHTLFVDAAGELRACGHGAATGHGEEEAYYPDPLSVIVMAGISIQSVAAFAGSSLALGWDGRVYSWGSNDCGQQGHGDMLDRSSPALVQGLEGVRGVDVSIARSLAVTQLGAVSSWGRAVLPEAEQQLQPSTVEGFGAVHVRRACMGMDVAFAIGEDGELFLWGLGQNETLGHGDMQDQPSPKRVEALRGIRLSSISCAVYHALSLAGDGLVYAWGGNRERTIFGIPHVESELLPRPVEALRGVRVGSVLAARKRSYVVADTGEVWAWGDESGFVPLGHGEQGGCPLPKPIEPLRGVKVDAVAANSHHALALADDGSVYVWGDLQAADAGALGLGHLAIYEGRPVPTPQRIPALRVTCGL
jgi:alpha-tubulin suppressor-like RCC1 family protein